MYCVMCVRYEHVCVCIYMPVWRAEVKKVRCLPQLLPILFFMSLP